MKKISKVLTKVIMIAFVLILGNNIVFANADAPLAVINNLSTFMFSIIKAVGTILLLWGVVQIGMSLKSHDPSQRANGLWSLAGGLIITFAKDVLDFITAV